MVIIIALRDTADIAASYYEGFECVELLFHPADLNLRHDKNTDAYNKIRQLLSKNTDSTKSNRFFNLFY